MPLKSLSAFAAWAAWADRFHLCHGAICTMTYTWIVREMGNAKPREVEGPCLHTEVCCIHCPGFILKLVASATYGVQ